MHIVMVSFNTPMRHMTEMSQLAKYVSVIKNKTKTTN